MQFLPSAQIHISQTFVFSNISKLKQEAKSESRLNLFKKLMFQNGVQLFQTMVKITSSEILNIPQQYRNLYPYTHTVLISNDSSQQVQLKSVGNNTLIPDQNNRSKSFGTGIVIAPFIVLTSKFVLVDPFTKELLPLSKIKIYKIGKEDSSNSEPQQEIYQIDSIDCCQIDDLETAIAILKLKNPFTHVQNFPVFGVLDDSSDKKFIYEAEVVGYQIDSWDKSPHSALKRAEGEIIEINENTIYHQCSTQFGFGGGPILLLKQQDQKIFIGLHFGTNKIKNSNFGVCFTKKIINQLVRRISKLVDEKSSFILTTRQIQTGKQKCYDMEIVGSIISELSTHNHPKNSSKVSNSGSDKNKQNKSQDNDSPPQSTKQKPYNRAKERRIYGKELLDQLYQSQFNPFTRYSVGKIRWNLSWEKDYEIYGNIVKKMSQRVKYILSSPLHINKDYTFKITLMNLERMIDKDQQVSDVAFGLVLYEIPQDTGDRDIPPVHQMLKASKNVLYELLASSRQGRIIQNGKVMVRGCCLNLLSFSQLNSQDDYLNVKVYFEPHICKVQFLRTGNRQFKYTSKLYYNSPSQNCRLFTVLHLKNQDSSVKTEEMTL